MSPPRMFAALVLPVVAQAQDLEPRRWTHMPVGTNVASVNYAYTTGDVFFDPVLELQDVQLESHAIVGAYTRSFDVAGTTGRLDAILPFQSARWKGLLSGAPASALREGFSDPWLRFSVGLLGTPALDPAAMAEFRRSNPVRTVVGAALGVMFPLGEYDSDKLLNLGQNRFIFRPQLGVTHLRGPWSYELTGSLLVYTDNTDFFRGNTLEQDPLFALQGHVVRSFASGFWASAGLGYNWSGASTINGTFQDDSRGNLLYAFSVGAQLSASQGFKIGYFRGDALENIGSDYHNVFVSWSVLF